MAWICRSQSHGVVDHVCGTYTRTYAFQRWERSRPICSDAVSYPITTAARQTQSGQRGARVLYFFKWETSNTCKSRDRVITSCGVPLPPNRWPLSLCTHPPRPSTPLDYSGANPRHIMSPADISVGLPVSLPTPPSAQQAHRKIKTSREFFHVIDYPVCTFLTIFSRSLTVLFQQLIHYSQDPNKVQTLYLCSVSRAF